MEKGRKKERGPLLLREKEKGEGARPRALPPSLGHMHTGGAGRRAVTGGVRSDAAATERLASSERAHAGTSGTAENRMAAAGNRRWRQRWRGRERSNERERNNEREEEDERARELSLGSAHAHASHVRGEGGGRQRDGMGWGEAFDP